MILVTGGAGFVGSHIVKALVRAGENVRVFDNLSRGDGARLPANVAFYKGDIRDPNDVMTAAAGASEVVHLAYINGTATFYERPAEIMDVGIRGMINLLDACRANGVRKMMLVSSSEVCRSEVGRMDEDAPLVIPDPHNPRFSYATGKIASEMMALHSGQFDLLTIIRPFNVYGPGMSEGHVIPDFKKKIESGETPFTIMGNGEETRSFCYIDDFVDGFMIMREYGGHNGIHNIGNPEEVSIRSLAERMARICGVELTIAYEKGRDGSIARRRPDIKKAQDLGYHPKVTLDDGLRRTLCHVKHAEAN